MTLFDAILKDINATLNKPLSEPLILKFDSDAWEFIHHEMLDAKSLAEGSVPYTRPISLRAKCGEVILQLLIPIPPMDRGDLH